MIVTISRHKPTHRGAVGPRISAGDYEAAVVPRVGEIITVHPDHRVSEHSWTGRVTGVQHVFSRTHTAHLTVLEGA